MGFGMMAGVYEAPGTMIFGLAMIAIWTLIWKGFALWHSAKNQQKGWFIAMLILNTMGLLPIIYLIWFKPKCEECAIKEEKATQNRTTKRVVKKKSLKKTTKRKR